jgi:hypothetical protein
MNDDDGPVCSGRFACVGQSAAAAFIFNALLAAIVPLGLAVYRKAAGTKSQMISFL